MHWRLSLSKIELDVRYRKEPLTTQADALFCLRSLEETTFPVDTDTLTYALHSDVTLTNYDDIDELDAYLALTSDTSSSYGSTNFDEVRLA